MPAALTLILFLAGPGAAAEPAPAATVSPAIEALEKEFDELCLRMEERLSEVKDIRAAYPRSADKAALEARFDVLLSGFADFAGRENSLRSDHRGRLRPLHLLAFSETMARTQAGDRSAKATEAMVFAYENVSRLMKQRSEKLISDFGQEADAIKTMREAESRRRASRRPWLLAATAGLVGLAGLAAGLVLLYLREAPRPVELAAPPLLAPPAQGPVVAGNFELLAPLGRGAMGEVFEAVDKTLNRRAALKRLRPELLADPAELERLLKEARLMASLKHPNLVAIYSVEKDADQVYLALEFIDGTSLQRRLDAEHLLPWPEALRIAKGVGAALDYAHERKIVHRDLKPANIMLSKKGEVKVMDFGIAHQAARSVSRLTRAPAWGTPAYMAPEQEMGGLSSAVDIYALSVCLYEMLTGELPFKGPNFLAQKRERLYAAPSGLAAGLPAGVDALFAAALAPEPSLRFKSAAVLLAACDALNS